ncbi:heavy metal translocating P-type ATPase [Amycolatopsis cihanbeyliensis]|uniref:Cu2+-exporting ATPase n=1 Tax=Amycolatopsis cihanbeyliensis TaxID=1128664 RepID=A0A542DMP2_AMYCI|nr:heavy metal translocating P-type ATPase [Amycolatopsis cihanbeyliensis]TQJ04244.1 Cu2+-exporting ATPase [Amycolatopsis cihanbeyliensis]
MDTHAGHETGQHEHEHGDHAAVFRDRFWLSLGLSVPVVAGSHMVADLLGYHIPPWAGWVAPVLGTVVFLYGGWPFLSGAVGELRQRQPGMMTLVALAISVAFIASGLTSLGVGGLRLDFWWELALLVVIMLLGHWLEMRALGQASGALEALAELLPDDAERVEDGGEVRTVTLDELRVGDVVLVRSGGRVPADGTVAEGAAELDESMVTGESGTVRRAEGDQVVAGTVATDSAIRIRVDAVGEDTALAGIQRLVADAQGSRSRAQALADRAAALLFWFALLAGVLTYVVWSLLGGATDAVERTVTVLVIACPHALGLAIPLVIAISTGISARAGILVTDRLALERMRTVDTVLFDKTGTLTRGRPAVSEVLATGRADEDTVLGLAAAAEHDSEHPLAAAIVDAASERMKLPRATGFRSLTGRGVVATVDGKEIAVGGPSLLRHYEVEPPAELDRRTRALADRGATVLHVLRDGGVIGALALADEIRPESRQAVDALHAEGVRVVMITGDARNVAESVAAELGVDEVFAEVLPQDKDSAVARLQERGQRVAMVGDGVNDAPALARADVGIAIGAGTDVAIESAGVVLVSDDPRGVLAARRLSVASYRKMWQNLGWAAGYNLAAVPLAAGVLASVGFVLPPAVGAVVMSLSTIVVALNAQLLRRVRLSGE